MGHFSSHIAAFVSSSNSVGARSALASARCLATARPASSTALAAVVPVKDFTSSALGFFTGVRIPSALIAGSSLGAFFTLIDLAKDADHKTRTEYVLVRVYHAFSLLSLCLSLNVVITSTVAATTLLLGHYDTMATSAYEFLRREMNYEFVSTRWSFLTSLLCFVAGIMVRAFLEFDLTNKSRRRAAAIMFFSMTALLFHLLSYINSTLICWSNLGEMTVAVMRMYVHRAFVKGKLLEVLSVACSVTALACLPWAMTGLPVGRLVKKTED